MRILFVSNELIGSALCLRLVREKHDVKLYIHDPARKHCLGGLVEKTSNWKRELKWVGKEGLIIFDDVGFGSIQDDLRRQGYSVFGGTFEADKLEQDRALAQRVLHNHKIKILPSFNFKDIDSAIDFIKENKGKWVVKQTSHISSLNLVGEEEDGKDIIERLHLYKKLGIKRAHLQKKADGVEVGVGRYFNGEEWVGPIEVNHEHKRLLNGDQGPLTAEMGTVMWLTNNESLPLFEKTLKKITPYLKKINFKGDIDVNCIVTKDAVWPLELTPRLGSPATQLHCELFESSLGKFIHAVAQGRKAHPKYKKGFGVVVSIAIPPFPYPPKKRRKITEEIEITFKRELNENDWKSIHFEEVSVMKEKKGSAITNNLYWSGEFGYVCFITASDKSLIAAQRKAYKTVSEVNIPDMIYRTDIGSRVHKHDLLQLKKWGWI
jgi:phosphoribosylamine--glycine ligase